MMKIVNVVPEETYRGLEGVNYSSLSSLANSPQAYRIGEQKTDGDQSPAMILGSVVDLLLTNKEKFDSEVYVMTASKPGSEMMLRYCLTLAETGDQVKAYDESGFKLSLSAIANKFDKEGRAYYDALIAAEGKMIIDAEALFTANQIVTQLTTNPFTKRYFIKEDDSIDLLFQVPIQWNIHFISLITTEADIVPAKSMLDVIRIDHRQKLIQPVDLKTGGEGFMKSYWKYHRYLQGAMYTDAVVTAEWSEDISKYDVEPMRFVYADTNLFYNPVVYKMTPKDVHIGRSGINYIEPIGGKVAGQGIDSVIFGTLGQLKRKGYLQLTAELDWHRKNDKWEYDYDTYRKHGEIDINAFAVKL